MPFDQNVQQQLMMLAMQDPQTFQQISQSASNMMTSRNDWGGQNQVQNWDRPVMTQNYGMAPVLHGRMINDPQEIRANEISQDGVPSFFPTNDWSTIYAKAWNSDGRIDTIRFVREQPVLEVQGPSEFDQVMERLDKLEQTLSQQLYQRRQNNNYQNNRNRRGNEEVTPNDES